MHIGINTGPASLGATKIEGRAGTRWTYTASGLTTNIAARLAAVAGAGEIVISETTRDLLGPRVDVEDLTRPRGSFASAGDQAEGWSAGTPGQGPGRGDVWSPAGRAAAL